MDLRNMLNDEAETSPVEARRKSLSIAARPAEISPSAAFRRPALESHPSTSRPSTSSSSKASVPPKSSQLHQPSPKLARTSSTSTPAPPKKQRIWRPGQPIPIYAQKWDHNAYKQKAAAEASSQQQNQNSHPPRQSPSQPQRAPAPPPPHQDEVFVTPKAFEEVTKRIADFVYFNCGDIPTLELIELEAKFGHIVDRDRRERLRLPILTPAVIDQSSNLLTLFESSMTQEQHRLYNEHFNARFAQSSLSRRSDMPPTVTYKHTKQIDTFYETPQDVLMRLPAPLQTYHANKKKLRIRVTRDQTTGEVLAKIIKVRMGDLDVFAPSCPFDWRVSVNLEWPYKGPVEELVEVVEFGKRTPERTKDRVSYEHLGVFQWDLTQVTAIDDNSATKEHELELEMKPQILRTELEAVKSGRPNRLLDLMQDLVDNIRAANREILPPIANMPPPARPKDSER